MKRFDVPAFTKKEFIFIKSMLDNCGYTLTNSVDVKLKTYDNIGYHMNLIDRKYSFNFQTDTKTYIIYNSDIFDMNKLRFQPQFKRFHENIFSTKILILDKNWKQFKNTLLGIKYSFMEKTIMDIRKKLRKLK